MMLLLALFTGLTMYESVPAGTNVAEPCAAGVPVAFLHADVLTMRSPDALRDQTVLVLDGTVTAVGRDVTVPVGACRIDATGRVLMPGLADMHVHTAAWEMPLFLANGITLAREMNGSPSHLKLRDQLRTGEIAGPRLIVASPLMTKQEMRFRHRYIASAEDAAAAARDALAAGYDFLKIYDGLTVEEYAAFAAAAPSFRYRMDGHIPAAVGLEGVTAAGQVIEHMDKIAFALGGHAMDSASMPRLRAAFTANPVWVVPTIASLRAMGLSRSQEFRDRLAAPEMAYVDDETVAWWSSMARGPAQPVVHDRYYAFQISILKELVQLQTPLMLGTDCANPLTICGFSIHDELRALVRDAGLTPYQALQTATVNVGRFLGENGTGVIEPGSRADLLLLDGNPVSDFDTLRRPRGVMAGGVWYDRARLDALLLSAKRR